MWSDHPRRKSPRLGRFRTNLFDIFHIECDIIIVICGCIILSIELLVLFALNAKLVYVIYWSILA